MSNGLKNSKKKCSLLSLTGPQQMAIGRCAHKDSDTVQPQHEGEAKEKIQKTQPEVCLCECLMMQNIVTVGVLFDNIKSSMIKPEEV